MAGRKDFLEEEGLTRGLKNKRVREGRAWGVNTWAKARDHDLASPGRPLRKEQTKRWEIGEGAEVSRGALTKALKTCRACSVWQMGARGARTRGAWLRGRGRLGSAAGFSGSDPHPKGLQEGGTQPLSHLEGGVLSSR